MAKTKYTIKELKSLGIDVSSLEEKKLLKIPELNIEVTPLQDWSKPQNEIVVPKGFRKIKDYELILIIRKYTDEFLGKYKGQYNYFWIKQTPYAKENNYVSRLFLGRDLNLYSDIGCLSDSNEYGRVVFVRDLK